jgi:ribosomal protein S16
MLSTSARDGKVIKDLGFYNTMTKELKLVVENIRYQLKNGVQPTKSLKNLLFKQNILSS